MAASPKRKISVSLDGDLLDELERDGGNISARVNAAVRDELARRRQQRDLGLLLDRLAEERGPLDTPEDEAAIQHFMRLLGGPGDT